MVFSVNWNGKNEAVHESFTWFCHFFLAVHLCCGLTSAANFQIKLLVPLPCKKRKKLLHIYHCPNITLLNVVDIKLVFVENKQTSLSFLLAYLSRQVMGNNSSPLHMLRCFLLQLDNSKDSFYSFLSSFLLYCECRSFQLLCWLCGKVTLYRTGSLWHHRPQPMKWDVWVDEETPRRWFSSTLLPYSWMTPRWMNCFTTSAWSCDDCVLSVWCWAAFVQPFSQGQEKQST